MLNMERETPIDVDMFLTWKLLKNRTIFLPDELDVHSTNTIIKALILLEQDDPNKPIQIFINSSGGCVYSTLALYDAIQNNNCPIHTIGMGQAMSAAAWILLAGTPGHRKALPHTRIMLHEGTDYYGQDEKTSDLKIRAEENEYLDGVFADIIIKHTKLKDKDTIIKMLEKDIFWSAEQALKDGIIDEIRQNDDTKPKGL